MADAVVTRCGPQLIRVASFRGLSEVSGVPAALRSLGNRRWARFRWVGRRLLDDPQGMEVVVVSLWDDAGEMERAVAAGRSHMPRELLAALDTMTTEGYACRAYGAWRRDAPLVLLRIFRGTLVEGDPTAFDAGLAAHYVGLFAANPSCASIAAGIDEAGSVVLATLWTTWDAVVRATGGDLGRVLPIRLPGFEITGTAVHYELVAVEF